MESRSTFLLIPYFCLATDLIFDVQVEYRKSNTLVLVRSLIACKEAMDRIHRLGQRRPVQAIKLVVEDSIESRIVQVIYDPRISYFF